MKRILTLMILVLVVSVVFAGDQSPWIDMENCPICKNISADPELLNNMTWEHYTTATGFMTVTTVNPEFSESYAKAKAGMQEVIGKLMAGEEIEICAFCTSMSTFYKGGVSVEEFTSQGAMIMLLSSTDAEMIARMHEHTQKTIDFLKAASEAHVH